jgi:hypothetical protein
MSGTNRYVLTPYGWKLSGFFRRLDAQARNRDSPIYRDYIAIQKGEDGRAAYT